MRTRRFAWLALSVTAALLWSVWPLRIARAADVQWIGPNVGNWNDVNNWNPRIPLPGDNVSIDLFGGDYTVTLDVDSSIGSLTVASSTGTTTLIIPSGRTLTIGGAGPVNERSVLQLNGGTINGGGSLSVAGAMNWTGGTVNIPLTNSGTLNLTGGSSRNLSNSTLNNAGTVNWAGGAPWTFEYTATLNNQAGGVLNVQGDNSLSPYGSGSKILNNAGTLNKSAGTGAATFYVAFNNTGTVNVNSGTLRLDAGSTHAGTLNIPSGQTLQLANGTHDLG
ncbi:MAG: hypothetical protein HY673_15575, partial [Chloroflexi bacterium]|nr:hypothetical protein [Chloroflexota bacterium]